MDASTHFDPDRVETVTVDSYGTLVDTDAVERTLAEHVPDPEPVSKLWRSRSLLYTMVGNCLGFYQPFYEMNRDALTFALEAHDVDLSPEERDDILSAYHSLDVFADVRAGIERIRDGGYEVFVLSNGNPEMLDSMVAHADVGDLVSDTISAHEVGTFKPTPDIYRHGAARTGTPIDRILHVANPTFDVLGAMNAGMQAAWLDRDDDPWESFTGVDPDLVVDSFHEVAEVLDV